MLHSSLSADDAVIDKDDISKFQTVVASRCRAGLGAADREDIAQSILADAVAAASQPSLVMPLAYGYASYNSYYVRGGRDLRMLPLQTVTLEAAVASAGRRTVPSHQAEQALQDLIDTTLSTRDAAVLRAVASGRSARSVAVEYDVHHKTVLRWLAQARIAVQSALAAAAAA